ncbi:hypothetical protein Syun_006721 [Stephania yunnanensis]|uniref:Uncharacterized protein n=1 Tax=Stephania yunnanensis TaxID=152371 RepID=A0AAP0KZQ8_9MAGN
MVKDMGIDSVSGYLVNGLLMEERKESLLVQIWRSVQISEVLVKKKELFKPGSLDKYIDPWSTPAGITPA